ncbi:unnamed protein product [Prunus brigantina]
MSNLRRVLERQQQEEEEITRRRDEEDRELDEEEEEVVLAKYDAVGVLGLLSEQKLTTALRMLTYGASADQVDEISRMGKSTILLECLVRFCDAIENLYTREYLCKPTAKDLRRFVQKIEARGFLGMIGSIYCMHWQWKNCPTAWQGDYGNRKGQKSMKRCIIRHLGLACLFRSCRISE